MDTQQLEQISQVTSSDFPIPHRSDFSHTGFMTYPHRQITPPDGLGVYPERLGCSVCAFKINVLEPTDCHDRRPRRADLRVGQTRAFVSRTAQRFDDTHLAIALSTGPMFGALVTRQVYARAAAARASARLAGRSTAAGSSVVCGATGPAALGCAVLVFAGITLGTEWVILKCDEVLSRPQLEQALHHSIDALRLQLMAEYENQLLDALQENIRDLTSSMQASLRPIDSLRAKP